MASPALYSRLEVVAAPVPPCGATGGEMLETLGRVKYPVSYPDECPCEWPLELGEEYDREYPLLLL
jgi:hypothetical protein